MLVATTQQSLNTFVPTLVQGAGLTAFFSARTFLPAFATALTMRFGWQAEWFGWFGIELSTAAAPTWFTNDITLIVLGLLSALEIAATKSADARALMAEIDPYLKPAVAVLTYMLGTDGFGRSDTRRRLRHFFEVDRYFVTVAALSALARENVIETRVVSEALRKFNIDPEKPDPSIS